MGHFVDSKFQTYACEASCKEFIAEWESADVKTKADMEISFEGLRYPPDRKKILEYISKKEGERVADRMIAQFKAAGADTHSNKCCELLYEQARRDDVPHRLVGKNQWFEVYLNQAGAFFIETIDHKNHPSDQELIRLEAEASNRAYKDAIRIIRDNRFLIH